MTSEPTYPVRSAGDVPGLPSVSATNQQTQGRKSFVRSKRRRRPPAKDDPPDADEAAGPAGAAGEGDRPEDGHVDCLA